MERKKRYERSFVMGSKKPIKFAELEKALLGIWEEHSRRQTAKVSFDDASDTKNESAKNFLRREIYALGVHLRSAKPKWNMQQSTNKLGRTTTRPEKLENEFHALLFFVYEEDGAITRQERTLIARELEYAYRHNIEPELLPGFLYQSTNRNRLKERLASDFIEPAFRYKLTDS